VKAALIPPRGLFKTALVSDIHLVLAQVLRYPTYRNMYVDGIADTDYIILDNGAAEGQRVNNVALVRSAIDINADEIVLPDVIGNSEETITEVKSFLKAWPEYGIKKPINFMAVLQSQGASFEWQDCIWAFNTMEQITTIGIPRHFVDKDRYMRHQVCAWLDGKGLRDRFQVHLLGTNSKFSSEVSMMAKEFPWIRSVDSSLPYNYALAGQRLGALGPHVNRPKQYFEVDWSSSLDKDLMYHNIDKYMRWARGPEGTRS
jgi:hypothetical protein